MRFEKRENGEKKRAFAWLAGVFFCALWIIFPLFPVFPALSADARGTEGEKRRQELLLSSFTTRFSEENEARAHNIRLACKKINGYRLAAGETFSFNAAVGERTKARGFRDAAVILDGEFVPGTGGGVCQVSTTLYNAALLAGMDITRVRPHSLLVSYVPPSFDAMVSSSSDLCFKNGRTTPVAVRARAESGAVTVEFYGRNDGYSYRTESVTVAEIVPPDPIVTEGEKDEVIRAEKKGLKSEGYLLIYRRGRRVGGRRIRRDRYAAVQGEIVKKREEKNEEEEQKEPSGENDFIFEEESRKIV